MNEIFLLDTSVYVHLLGVKGKCRDRDELRIQFAKARNENHDTFLLPLVTILETGTHISRLPDGNQRWRFSKTLVEDVLNACAGENAYRPTFFPDNVVFQRWVEAFPEYAKRNKSPEKPNEGVSLTDLSIIKELELMRLQTKQPIWIWSLDRDLAPYGRPKDQTTNG